MSLRHRFCGNQGARFLNWVFGTGRNSRVNAVLTAKLRGFEVVVTVTNSANCEIVPMKSGYFHSALFPSHRLNKYHDEFRALPGCFRAWSAIA
jgi:hypothetical protein